MTKLYFKIDNTDRLQLFKNIALKYQWTKGNCSTTANAPLYVELCVSHNCPGTKVYNFFYDKPTVDVQPYEYVFTALTVMDSPATSEPCNYRADLGAGYTGYRQDNGVHIYHHNTFLYCIHPCDVAIIFERMQLYGDKAHKYYFPKIYYDVQPAVKRAIAECGKKAGWRVGPDYLNDKPNNVILCRDKSITFVLNNCCNSQVISINRVFDVLEATEWEQYYRPFRFNVCTSVPVIIGPTYLTVGCLRIPHSVVSTIYSWYHPNNVKEN